MWRLLVITALSAFLYGCATPYQTTGFRGGFSETQLDKNVFKVSFNGNGYTSRERTSDFVLLRSAELALENGYEYFAIIDERSDTSYSTYTTPTQTHTTANVYASGNYAHGNAYSTTTGGQTNTFVKPSNSNTIVCFTKKPDATPSYSASFVYKSIRDKYGMSEPND